jgi:hypothetical protein
LGSPERVCPGKPREAKVKQNEAAKLAMTVVLWVVALPGCGGLVGSDYSGAVNHVAGALSSSGAAPVTTAPIGVAILWLPRWVGLDPKPDTSPAVPFFGRHLPEPLPLPDTTGPVCSEVQILTYVHANTSKTTTQPIGVSSAVMYGNTLPSSFVIPLNQAPPAAALIDLAARGGRGKAAIGAVVAFEDLNGNGALDLGQPGQPAEPIIATSIDVSTATESRAVLYLDGILPRDLPWPEQASQGFNIVLQGPTRIETEPNSTPINIDTALAATYLQQVDTCATQEYQDDWTLQPPAGAALTCDSYNVDSPQHTSLLYAYKFYWFLRSTPSACVLLDQDGEHCYEPGQSVPAGYPSCPHL